MTAFSVWVFDTPGAAQRLLPVFEGTPHRIALPVDDLAVVSWPPDRSRPLAWQGRPVDDSRALAGAFWGMLFGEVFLLPLSCAPPGTLGTQPSDAQLAHLGLDEDVVHALRGLIVPGTSAVLVLHRADSRTIAAELPDGRGPALSVRLTAEQLRRLRAGFADADR